MYDLDLNGFDRSSCERLTELTTPSTGPQQENRKNVFPAQSILDTGFRMPPRRFNSLPEQVAASMRGEIAKGRWGGKVPGRDKLVQVMGVSGKTVEAALQLLQKEGLLEFFGSGFAL